MSAAQVAKKLRLTARVVTGHSTRIRTKLKLKTDAALQRFIEGEAEKLLADADTTESWSDALSQSFRDLPDPDWL